MNFVFMFNAVTLGSGYVNRNYNLAKKMRQKGENAWFFTFIKRREFDIPIESVGIPARLVDAPVLKHYLSFRTTRQLKRLNPKYLHVDFTPIDEYAYHASRKLKASVVYSYHGVADPTLYEGKARKIRIKQLERIHKNIRNADLRISVSKYMQRELEEQGIDSHVVYNGIDPEFFRPDVAETVDKKILFLSRLEPHKGVHFIIDAFKRIKREIPDATLDIAGSGANKEYYEQLLQKSKDVEGIHFLGKVPDILLPKLYASASLFVLPTLWEGFGMPFMEAQACGTPCVGFDLCSIPEVVQHGKTGLLVPPKDIDALSEACIEILSSKKKQETLSKNAYRWSRKFTWDKITDRFISLVQQV